MGQYCSCHCVTGAKETDNDPATVPLIHGGIRNMQPDK
jgi:hypothetical protein